MPPPAVLEGWEWAIVQAWVDLRGNDLQPALGLPLGKGIGEHGAAFAAHLRHLIAVGPGYIREARKRMGEVPDVE